jgi:hypothetical protein
MHLSANFHFPLAVPWTAPCTGILPGVATAIFFCIVRAAAFLPHRRYRQSTLVAMPWVPVLPGQDLPMFLLE